MKSVNMTILSGSILAAAVGIAGCQSQPPRIAWQQNGVPMHYDTTPDNWWSYQFVYHPNLQAYYEPYSQTWFWFENGVWYEGSVLPHDLQPDNRIASVVKVKTDHPFAQHDTVTASHPMLQALPPLFDPTGSKHAQLRFVEDGQLPLSYYKGWAHAPIAEISTQ